MRRVSFGLLVLFGALALAPADGTERPAPRVVLFGIDGLEWGEALPLVRAGEMPHLAALMRKGRYGRLRSFRPTKSPIIWTTIATGKDLEQHGIRGFGIGDRATGRVARLFNNYDRRAKAFWNVLSESGKRVGIVGWWMTYPVDPVDGVMVAQVNTLDQALGEGIIKGGIVRGAAGQVHPPSREAEILAVHDAEMAALPDTLKAIFGQPKPATPLATELWNETLWAFRADATYARVAETLAKEELDLLALYLGGTDVVGHRYWRYLHPEQFRDAPDASEIETWRRVIPDYYRQADAWMGRVLTAVGGDPIAIVVSDHGMHAENRDARFGARADGGETLSGDHEDAPAGVFVAAGPGITAQGGADLSSLEADALPTAGSVYDVMPTLLALFGLPVGDDMRGEVLTETFGIDPAGVSRVATHDGDFSWQSRLSRNDPDKVVFPNADERIEQLRALGYVE